MDTAEPKARVLIVEDDIDALNSMSEILIAEGVRYRLRTRRTGSVAVDA